MTLRRIELQSRRQFLITAASTAIPILGGIARPYLSLAAEHPLITHGLQSGDVDIDSGIVWARADRPARMQVEVATTDSFKDLIHGAFVDALPESDFTAKLKINQRSPIRTRYILSCPVSGPFFANYHRRVDNRPVSYRAARQAIDLVHLVR